MQPLARKDHCAVEVVREETLVYDLKTHRAHCLNPVAAMVWQACDGKTSAAEMARRLSGHFQAEVSEKAVRQALAELREAHLLEPRSCPAGAVIPKRRMTRRNVAAGAAFLWPVVTSLTIPAARAQRSFQRPPRPPRPPLPSPAR